MLDFYAVDDAERVRPKMLNAQTCAGGLEIDTYVALEPVWAVLRGEGIRPNYMRDFRLTAGQVVRALVVVDTLVGAGEVGPEPGQALRRLLMTAANAGKGLVAAAD